MKHSFSIIRDTITNHIFITPIKERKGGEPGARNYRRQGYVETRMTYDTIGQARQAFAREKFALDLAGKPVEFQLEALERAFAVFDAVGWHKTRVCKLCRLPGVEIHLWKNGLRPPTTRKIARVCVLAARFKIMLNRELPNMLPGIAGGMPRKARTPRMCIGEERKNVAKSG